MEAPFHSGSALGYGIMGDEQICIQRELRQSVSLAVCISTKNNALAAHFHSPCQRGKPTMNNAHCIHRQVGVAKHKYGFGAGYDIMRFQCVASFLSWSHQLAQVAPSSVRLTEKIAHKLTSGRHKFVPRRAVHRQGALAVFKTRMKTPKRKNRRCDRYENG